MVAIAPTLGPVLNVPQSTRTWFTDPSRSADPCGNGCEDPVEAIRQLGQSIFIRRDETLFFEGDPAAAVYLVVSGTVRISKMLSDGRRQIVGFREEGELIGLALAEDYPYSAEGVTPVRVRRLGRTRLEALMETHPRLRQRLFLLAAHELAAAQRQILLLGRKTARERICSFLLERQRGAAPEIELPMSRTDIADYLGLTIETVSRTLSQLRAEGLIRMPTLHNLQLSNPDRLCDLAEAA
ncbi:MAG TPA: helix-turn-helix domain-containing protein [Alphaproteobacteria bacterium]|nr:helix-turn-helix domain-containing protein [Alphaproteobacteria bacterium]